MKVHNFRVEAAEGRKLEQLLRAPISNPKQEAETMHWKQHMAFDISKSVPVTFSSARTYLLNLLTQYHHLEAKFSDGKECGTYLIETTTVHFLTPIVSQPYHNVNWT